MVAALLLAASHPSSVAAPSVEPRCFSPRDITHFRVSDIHKVLLLVADKSIYEVTFASPCPDVDWNYGFVVRGSGDRVCEGSNLDVRIAPTRTPESGMSTRCRITNVRRLSAQEVAALPGRLRP